MTAKVLRSMIHESERATITSNPLTRDHERALAAEACVALWETFDDAKNTRALRKLVSCARRLARLSWERWAGLLIALEKIFHNGLDSAAQAI